MWRRRPLNVLILAQHTVSRAARHFVTSSMIKQQKLPDDEQLIPLLLKRDPAAYRQVVQAYHGLMVQVAKALVGAAIADEVAQEAWLAMVRALPGFEHRCSLKNWLLRIVSNTAKTRLRHESRKINLGDLAADPYELLPGDRFDERGHWHVPPRVWETDDPEALLASDQLRDCLEKSLAHMPDLQQAVVLLRDQQGLEMDEICKILEVSESNARVLLHRARTRIRNMLERYHEDGIC